MSELIFCYQSFGYNEKAMALIQEIKERIPLLPRTQQKKVVKLFYLEGIIYGSIQFYRQAEQSLQTALDLIEQFPEMASSYLLTIQYQQLQILSQKKSLKQATQKISAIYQTIIDKGAAKLPFSKNDYFVILALSIDYSNIKIAEKAKTLFALAQPMQEEFPKLKDMIVYIQALDALHKGDEACYAQQMLHLLGKLDDSWPSSFTNRVKQQASQYFSQKMQYKRAYLILMEN